MDITYKKCTPFKETALIYYHFQIWEGDPTEQSWEGVALPTLTSGI
jgi:hypothetical protein